MGDSMPPLLSNSDTIRLFKELGAIASKLDGLQAGQDAHERLDIERLRLIDERHSRHEQRISDLEEADVTGQHDNLEEVKRKAARLEQREADEEKKKKADEEKRAAAQLEARRATIRTAITLCIGGLITILTGFAAHALGLK